MESLKLLQELNAMSDSLNVGTLRHFFKHFDTSSSRALHQTITHFHIKELESADYRSAYGQLSDWLYGWTVTDVTEMVDELLDHFKIKRPTREIDLRNDRERLEAERIMKIYETLFHITRRLLNKYYSDLDAEIPKIGKGVGTFKNGQEEENEFLDEDKDVEKVWALKSVEDLDNGEPLPDLNMLDSDQEEDQLTFQQKNSDVVVKRSSILHVVKETPKDKMHGSIIEEEDEDEGQEEGSEAELENDGFLPGAQDQESSRASSSQGHKIEKALSIEEGLPSNNAGFQFMKASSGEDMTKAPTLPTQLDEFENMQRDINHIYLGVDRCTDYSLVTLSTIMVVMSLAELLNDKETYSKYAQFAHELSMDFVSNTLKAVWDLLNKELPGQVSLAELRNLNVLRLKIRRTLELRKKDGKVPKFKIRKLHFKFALLHDMFTMTDIFIFPNFVAAQKDGLKCARYSDFDNSLWLTGGNDCCIRIHDIRVANRHVCLAQYAGHRSIITDIHFNKKESHIISSSFDRTIKLWNSQSSSCERTFIGHTDAVLSCDLSPDGKYIASGSIDNTVKLWDLATGECITTAKKHGKWVKIVRFSPDGKYLVSASLDRRILIWETKLIVNSKTPVPSRCIDIHLDYVLDIAIHRNLMLSTSRDGSVRLFDIVTGQEQKNSTLSPSWACTVCFSDNGEYFATGSFDNNIVIFKTSDFSKVRQIRVFNFGIMVVRFPMDLRYIVVGTTEGFLQQIPL